MGGLRRNPVRANGKVIVVSAPSGAGKGTILRRVIEEDDCLTTTVSATTRRPRPAEQDGLNYHFISAQDFDAKIAAGEFLEWAQVHGNRYGTLLADIEARLATGRDVALELDVQGMRSVKASWPEAVSVFIMPPSMEELERRIRQRGAISEAELAMRLRNAQDEIAARAEYDYIVYNNDLETAVRDFRAILRGLREGRTATKTE